MKVAVFIEPWIKQRAGIGFYTSELIKMLSMSARINLITIGSQRFSDEIEHYFFPSWKSSFFNPFRYAGLFTENLKNQGVEVIIDPAHYAVLGLFKNVSVVTVVHDITPLLFPRMHKFQSVLAHKFLLPISLRRSSRLITVSNNTNGDLIRAFPHLSGAATTLYPSIRKLAIGEIPSTLPAKFFLCVGTIEPRKNHEKTIAAFSMLARRQAEVCLVIVGDDGWKTNLNAIIKESPYRDRIYQLGYVSDDVLGGLYSRAIALVYPSFYEGFGLPVVEAMSLSCCVITANNSSLSEVAGEAAILIDSGSISELCMAMEEVYLDEKLRADLKQKGREQLKRFDTKHQLEILERLLLAINAV